jgi:type 1 fimbriae regulatory protein FimB
MPKKTSGKVQWGQMNTYQHLTPSELHSLLAEAQKHSTRNWLMLLTMYLHGLRVSELLGLTRESIQGETLIVQRLKNGYLNVQPLHASEAAQLHKLVLATAPGKQLFSLCRQQVYRIMRNYAEMIGLPPQKCHPHCLRHSIAMHTVNKVGVHNVRQWLGHRSLGSTGHYLRASDNDAAEKVFAAIVEEKP